jgi:hypothetical protein
VAANQEKETAERNSFFLNLKSIAFCEGKHTATAQKKWAAAFERHLDVHCPVALVFDLWVFDLWVFDLWVFDL